MGKGKPSRALTQRDDDELVAHVRGGCADAFAVLHARYHSPVLAFVRRTLPRALAGDAEDVTQEVFLRAYRGLHATGNAIQLRPWLFRIAFNRCMDCRRRRSPTATDWQIDAAPAMAPGPHAQFECREELASMIADIGQHDLPADPRGDPRAASQRAASHAADAPARARLRLVLCVPHGDRRPTPSSRRAGPAACLTAFARRGRVPRAAGAGSLDGVSIERAPVRLSTTMSFLEARSVQWSR